MGSEVEGGLSNAQAGDIVCYSGHVGIYIGNGQIVHASTEETGIKVSEADYRTPITVRRIFKLNTKDKTAAALNVWFSAAAASFLPGESDKTNNQEKLEKKSEAVR